MADKHLALNVPTDFSRHVEFARREITANGSARGFSEDKSSWALHRYRRPLQIVSDPPNPEVALRLFEIECRFIALLKTIDQSVPIAPLHKKYSALARTLQRHNERIVDDEYTIRLLDYDGKHQNLVSVENFRNASSLAEKAFIAKRLTSDFEAVIQEIATHFDYKRAKFGRGARRTYSLIYAVLALALEFEADQESGRVAAVSLSVDGSQHEGEFLSFVLSFIQVVDAGTIGLRPTDGFNERVRKIAMKRHTHVDIVRLLDQRSVNAEVMLDFMARADDLKA